MSVGGNPSKMHDSCKYLRPLWQSQQEYGLIFWSCVVWGQSLLSYIYTCRVICLCYVHACVWYPMLSVSLGCPFLIAPSPFSNVYFENYIGVIFKSLDYERTVLIKIIPHTRRIHLIGSIHQITADDKDVYI